MKKLQTITSLIAAGAIVATPFLAFAETNVDASANTETRTSVYGLGKLETALQVKAKANDQEKQQKEEDRAASTTARLNTKGDKEIDTRIESLDKLETRVNDFARLSADQKASLISMINAEISTLTQLKAQIASESASTTLKADVESITKDNRVFALVMPKISIAAASDRILAIAAQMEALAPKLQARITAAATAGHDMTAAQTAYADMNAKVADSKVQAQAAVSLTANLQADHGDKTVFAANQQALKDARAKLQAAHADLVAARKDVNTILKAVKGAGVGAMATTTASTTVSH